MAEVPYSAAPEREPRFEPTPSVNVQATPAAFGVNVAQALEHLGEVQEGAGKELFDRAYAMQTLHEQAKANAAAADTENKQLSRLVDFRNLQGKDAVDAYPTYQSNLDADRQAGRANLSPQGQLWYDQETRRSTNQLKFSGATHAAQENKTYVVGSSKAATEAAINGVAADPTNEGAFKANLEKIKTEANHQADIKGLPPNDPERELAVKTDVSRAYERRISGLAETGHFKEAQDLFNQATASKDLISTGTDAYGRTSTQRLQEFITQKKNTIGARVGASTVMHGDYPGWTEGKLNDTGLLAALRSSEGGSYTFRGPTVTDKAGNTGQALGHYGVMSYNLQGWLRESGMGPMTEDEFLHNPSAQEQLVLFKMKQYQDRYGSAKAAAKAWFGGPGSVNTPDDQLRDKNMNFSTYFHNFTAGVAGNASLKEKTDMGRRWATDNGYDVEGADAVVGNIERLDSQEQRIRRDTELSNLETIDNAMVTGDQAGKIPSSIEELTIDPKVKEAWEALKPSDQLKVMNALARNAKGDVRMTPERLQTYQMLVGESIHDPEKFLKEDLIGQDLPISVKKELISRWARVRQHAEADPNVSAALRIPGIAMKLRDLGYVKGEDEESLKMFSATLGDEISAFARSNGRQPKSEEVEQIAGRLLQDTATGEKGWFGTQPTEKFFKIPAPYDWGVQVREKVKQTLGYEPTDDDINRWWNQMQYQKQYGGTAPLAGVPGAK